MIIRQRLLLLSLFFLIVLIANHGNNIAMELGSPTSSEARRPKPVSCFALFIVFLYSFEYLGHCGSCITILTQKCNSAPARKYFSSSDEHTFARQDVQHLCDILKYSVSNNFFMKRPKPTMCPQDHSFLLKS